MTSRFCFLGVRAANEWEKRTPFPPREEWLILEWPEGREGPTDYWLSNLPADTEPERLARLARLRWKIELDYKQLKGELGLDHYEGRSWIGWATPHRARHRRPRLPDRAPEPKSPAAGLTLPRAVQLFQALFKCPTGRCQTCSQPIELDQLPLHPIRQDE